MLNDINVNAIPRVKPLPSDTKLVLNIALDAGSTETRTILYSSDGLEEMPEVDVEPSTFAKLEYSHDLSDIQTINPKLMDCFEVRLRTINEEKYTILKGSLAKKVGESKKSSSAKSKMEQDSTMVNIHSAVIMNIIKQMIERQFALDTSVIVSIKLTLALPPEDTDPARVTKLRKEFEGVYEASLPRLNLRFQYSIMPEDVEIVSECNATAMFYMCTTEDNEDANVIVMECGGRSSSAAIIKDGVLLSRGHCNFELGGKNLMQMITDCIAEARATSKISMDNAEKALCTGFIKQGSLKVPVYEEINEAKQKFAVKVVENILTAIESAEMSVDDVQAIVVSGRIFGELITKDGTVVSPSLGAFIKQVFQEKWCRGTEVIKMSTKYPIPQGLVLYRMGTE